MYVPHSFCVIPDAIPLKVRAFGPGQGCDSPDGQTKALRRARCIKFFFFFFKTLLRANCLLRYGPAQKKQKLLLMLLGLHALCPSRTNYLKLD